MKVVQLFSCDDEFIFLSQDSVVAAEEANDEDVVLIKDEIAKEEVNENEAVDELLLNEDGKTHTSPTHSFINQPTAVNQTSTSVSV